MEPVAHQGYEVADASALHALGTLLQLGSRARDAETLPELGFILANETHQLADYRQAAVWSQADGITTLSGVVSVEANAPYVQWLSRVVAHALLTTGDGLRIVPLDASALPEELAREWADWLPAEALLIVMPALRPELPASAVVFARDESWEEAQSGLLLEWARQWQHAEQSLRARSGMTGMWWRWKRQWAPFFAEDGPGLGYLPQWMLKTTSGRLFALLLLACFYPVQMTVLAQAEVVSSRPVVLRAPQDGVIDEVLVAPNQTVKKGDALARLETLSLQSRLTVSEQALTTAEAEYRQSAQVAVFDVRGKAQLAMLQGKIREKQAEVQYLRAQLERATLRAVQAGVVILDDPTELLGKPVVTGERILSLSNPQDVELEAWLPASDLINLKLDSDVMLFLNSDPLTPLSAKLRYVAHEASMRPDGSYAYRVKAVLSASGNPPRLGLKGTAKLHGERVPLAYWVARRPLSVVRQTLGL